MPVADCIRELFGSVGGDEVAGTFDDDGPVIGESLLPPLQFVVLEGEVGAAPDDRWPSGLACCR
jgi:hypothetical protein